MKRTFNMRSLALLLVGAGLFSGCGAGGGTSTGEGGATGTGGLSTGGQTGSGTGGSAPGTGGMTVSTGGASGAGAGGSLGAGGMGTGGIAGRAGTGGGVIATGGAGGAAGRPATGGQSGTGGMAGSSTTGLAGNNGGGIDWSTTRTGAPPVTGTAVTGTVTVNHGTIAGKLAPGYAGFSFEKTHITDPYFTPNDAALIALFRLLGPGYIRIGGADVERCTWQAGAALGTAAHPVYMIGTAAVDQFAGFLQATGWKAIYGLPIQSATAAQTGAEAGYAASKLGASLAYFELGNEPTGSWSTNKPKLEAAIAAIQSMAPGAKLAGPAQTGSTSYDSSFATDENGKIAVDTHHYYRGIGTSPSATIPNMLSTDPNLLPTISALAAIVKAHPQLTDGFRLGETNSYWHHGSPNVSNTYAAAVWGVDYMLTTAQGGCAGVHFHGGGENMDGNTCTNGLSSCTSPFVYSPIAEDASQVAIIQGVYYAMLVISQVGSGNLLATTTSVSGANFHAYALALADGSTEIVLVNKDTATGVNATVDVGATVTSAAAAYLLGPSLSATTGMTFGGSEVSIAGKWAPSAPYGLSVSAGKFTVGVPFGSAVVIRTH